MFVCFSAQIQIPLRGDCRFGFMRLARFNYSAFLAKDKPFLAGKPSAGSKQPHIGGRL